MKKKVKETSKEKRIKHIIKWHKSNLGVVFDYVHDIDVNNKLVQLGHIMAQYNDLCNSCMEYFNIKDDEV